MDPILKAQDLAPQVLLEIIQAQTEIVKLGHDLGSVMNLVVERVRALTEAAGAIVELAEGEEMVYRAASGLAAPQLGLRLARATSLSGLCVKLGEVLCCEDCETDPRVDREACRRVGLRSMVVAPLFHGDTVVGVLKIVAREAQAFARAQVNILTLMSGLIASAMFRAAEQEVNELYHRATHDVLTGLANRALFHDRLRQGLALARRQECLLGVVNLDMDGLKDINDRHGHRAGDAAIRELARRLAQASRESDTVARLGGDEFGVILPGLRDREGTTAHLERLARELHQPFEFENAPLALGASMGLALFPVDAEEPDSLLEMADQSMYAQKRTRKHR
jgi:diguanylate cyclase (GGDEF)-like protein